MRFIMLILAAALISACGPKVTVSKNEIISLRKVALLPVKSETQITRERLEILQKSLLRSLTAKGYQVVDLTSFCNTKDCENWQTVTEFSRPDALVQLSVSSSNSANILAGHYYSISGRLDLYDLNKEKLSSIEHTESDRGGLLFNTGQVLEGLKSTANSLEGDFFPGLADKFTKITVGKLPAPKGELANSEIVLENGKIIPLGSGRFSICADAPLKNNGIQSTEALAVKIGKFSYPLRKVSDKTFCGSYLVDRESASLSSLQLTASNLYGQNKTISISNPLLFKCKDEDLVVRDGDYLRLGSKPECKGVVFSVYSANMASGPFLVKQKSASSGSNITLGKPAPNYVSVIAISDVLATPEQLIIK